MTTSDMKELLTLAAKACELPDAEWVEALQCINYENNRPHFRRSSWNPLTGDGDYSRMEAQLGLEATWLETHVEVDVNCSSNFTLEFYADHNGDKQAARRAAGTRLAAEIGRMK